MLIDVHDKETLEWIDQDQDLLWYQILFDDTKLQFNKYFILSKKDNQKRYNDYVNESLLSAAQSMKSIPGEMIGILQLQHTASSIILIEGNRRNIDRTLEFIKTLSFYKKDMDPTTILTAVSLYFLIRNAEHFFTSEETLEDIKYLHNRLDQMNWFIGHEGVQTIGIKSKEECLPEKLKTA